MSEHDHDTGFPHRLVSAYEHMLARSKQSLSGQATPLRQAIDRAKDTAVELGELTREEAEKVGDYVLRDLEDAARFVNQQETELGDWLRLDILLIETDLLNRFSLLVDRTRAELDKLALDAAVYGEWHSGEVTGPGTLQCIDCGERLHFSKVSHIPPCPKCHGSRYRRAID